MKISGKIFEIYETQQVSDTFKKRSFILEYLENPQYPEYVSFELIQERCGLIDDFAKGQEIEVSFNLKGRKWTNAAGETKYFNSLQAWRIDEESTANNGNSEAKTINKNNVDDDLPF
jgi:hypothetical protein